MISANETMLTLAEAAELVPSGGGRRGVEFSTVWRWATKGCRGVKLEKTRIGGRLFTSAEALQRFFDALTANDEAQRVPTVTDSKRKRMEAAERELAAAGV